MAAPTLDLDGKVALVTGASKGIGRAIASAFADAGASVMISSRKQETLDEAAKSMTGGVATFAANAGEPDQAEACVAATVDRFGGVDVLVNNAATNPHMGPVIDVDLPRYDKTFQVNVRGPLVWTQAAWRARMQEHGGSVINISSVGGIRHDTSIGVYNVTKAALIHLTKILAAELAPKVRVNAIAPGLVKTDFARALWEPAEDLVAATMPLGRLGEPEDIAGAALFLASDLSSWMTGEVIVVDGGALVREAR
jgi:NAD(P)-dependent dehydrogenase (short-subunit alcohol dehydrogenase family)